MKVKAESSIDISDIGSPITKKTSQDRIVNIQLHNLMKEQVSSDFISVSEKTLQILKSILAVFLKQ